jgi:histidine triad (HIT) family protein
MVNCSRESSAVTKNCKFCRIVDGSLPSLIVAEDEVSLTFLDHRPLFPGHCLLVPRIHCETMVDLPPEFVGPFFSSARMLTVAVEEAMGAEGTFVAVNNKVSQSVPHLHVHVVPRRRKDGLRGFFWPRNLYRDEVHMEETAEVLRAAITRLRSG